MLYAVLIELKKLLWSKPHGYSFRVAPAVSYYFTLFTFHFFAFRVRESCCGIYTPPQNNFTPYPLMLTLSPRAVRSILLRNLLANLESTRRAFAPFTPSLSRLLMARSTMVASPLLIAIIINLFTFCHSYGDVAYHNADANQPHHKR